MAEDDSDDFRDMFAECMVLPLEALPFDRTRGYSVADERGRPLFGLHVPGQKPETFILYGGLA